MPGDTMRNYCEKKRLLVTMTVALSSAAFAMLCTGVLTDYWLHSREQIGETGANGTINFRVAHSGLWRKCTAFDETGESSVCEAIKYFGETDDEQTDLTQTIVLSIRRATVFPLICIGLLLAGSVICFIGHCNYRHKYLTFIAGILFIFSGLFNLVGIVLYIGSVTQEVGNRKPKEMEENPRFVYNYGISFVLTVSSFVLSEFTGVICIYLYISRHKSALRKVQTRAFLQRSHSEADVDAMRRRRIQSEAASALMSTPATPTGARTSSQMRRSSDVAPGDLAQQHPPPHQSQSTTMPRKTALSINELRPMIGNHTPLMSTSAPRWCPPPPVRFVPASSAGTPQAASWRSLPRTLSQPLSSQHQQPHVMFDRQQKPSMVINNSSSVGYTAPNNDNSDLARLSGQHQLQTQTQQQPRQHRHHHRRSKERRATTEVTGEQLVNDYQSGAGDVLSPNSNNSGDQPPPHYASVSNWNINSRTPHQSNLSSYPAVAYQQSSGGCITPNHVSRIITTADYFPSSQMQPTSILQQPQSLSSSVTHNIILKSPPIACSSQSHSQYMTATPHQFWRIPAPPMSPPEVTTNDDLSSTSAVDNSNSRNNQRVMMMTTATAVPPVITGSYLHTAHDRNDRHAYKIKHKQGHHRITVQQQQQHTIERGSGVAGGQDFGDSSGDQGTASFDTAMFYSTAARRNQSLSFQRQPRVDLYEPPAAMLNPSISGGDGSLSRTPRMPSLANSSSIQQSDNQSVDAVKISAHVTHHRRTTPV